MSKGVAVSDSVGKEVDEDADPVSVVAIDGEAQIVVGKGIDTAQFPREVRRNQGKE